MKQARSYDKEFKVQAVKLAKETGTKKAAAELGVPVNTLSGWVHKAKNGKLDLGLGEHPPKNRIDACCGERGIEAAVESARKGDQATQ